MIEMLFIKLTFIVVTSIVITLVLCSFHVISEAVQIFLYEHNFARKTIMVWAFIIKYVVPAVCFGFLLGKASKLI